MEEINTLKVVNLCPHDVTVLDASGLSITFKATGSVARLESETSRSSMTLELSNYTSISLPVQNITRREVYGLPEPQDDTIYLTSYIVAKHVQRPDVFSPLTDSTAVRDEDNRIIGVKGFQRFV